MNDKQQLVPAGEQQPVNPTAGFDPEAVNLVHATQAMKRIGPMHVARLSVVKLSPNPQDGDCYHSGAFMKSGEVALTKQGLLKLSDAAGVCWDPAQCGLRQSGHPDIIIYEAVGYIIGVDGQKLWNKGTKELDTRADGTEVELIRQQAARKDMTEAARASHIRQETTRLRQHRVAMAETKAKLRVLREFVNVSSKYSAKALEKPFLIPHIDLSPDLSDPMVRELTASRGQAAIAALFGQPEEQKALPRPQEAPQEAPHDLETGEVLTPAQETQGEPRQPSSEHPADRAVPPTKDQVMKKVFGLARELEGTDGAKLAELIRRRLSRLAEKDGKDVCGWKDDAPSLQASTLEQLLAIAELYRKLLEDKRVEEVGF